MRVPFRRHRHDQTFCAVHRHPPTKTHFPLAVDDRRESAPSVPDTALSAKPQSGNAAKPDEIALQRAVKSSYDRGYA